MKNHTPCNKNHDKARKTGRQKGMFRFVLKYPDDVFDFKLQSFGGTCYG